MLNVALLRQAVASPPLETTQKKKKIILPFDLYESSLAEAWEKERDDFSWAKLDAIAR